MAKSEIPKIEISESELSRLVSSLDKNIGDAEEFKRSKWDEVHDMYWRMYLAQPDKEISDYPFPNSSNLFIPMTQVAIEGVRAQEYDAMLANDPTVKVVSFAGSGAVLDESSILSQFYNDFLYKEVINLREIGNDWLLDNCVDGTSAVKPSWGQHREVVRELVVDYEPITETPKMELFGAEMKVEPIVVGIEPSFREVSSIVDVSGIKVDVADMGRIYVAPVTGTSLQYPECARYFQEQMLTWEELMQRKQHGYKVDDDLKAALAEHDIDEKEKAKRKREGVSETKELPTVRVLEFYKRWPLPGKYIVDGKDVNLSVDSEELVGEEVIITYAPQAHKVLRIVPLQRVYPDGKRPHVDMRYTRLPRFFYGIGIPSKMRHLNAAMNTQWNQMIDYGHLSNVPWFLYEPAVTGALPNILGIRPGVGIAVANSGGVQFPRFNTDPAFWTNAMQQLQSWAEKVSAVSDYMLGRAPQTPNAPRTFRGQAAMMQQSSIAFSQAIAMHAEAFIELFRRVHALMRRYSPPEQAFRVLDRSSATFSNRNILRAEFEQDVDFQFVLNPNRMAEQQVNMAIVQTLTPILMQANPAGVRPLYKEWYSSMGKKNFEELWPSGQVPSIQTPEAQLPSPEEPPAEDLSASLPVGNDNETVSTMPPYPY